MINDFSLVDELESKLAEYTGAPYAIAVDSCTNALFLCCKYLKVTEVTIPSKTYLSVPQSIIHAGGKIVFSSTQNDWSGIYQLSPYPIYDSAKRLTQHMYLPGSYMCLSFHSKKHLKIGKGGMILCDNLPATQWFKRARYEGRSSIDYHYDDITELGWNMYMHPMLAKIGLELFKNLPNYNKDLDEPGGYRELTGFSVFKDIRKIP